MRYLLDVASDFHGAEYSPVAVALLCKHLSERRPNVFVFNGDVVDFAVVGSYGNTGRLAPSYVIDEVNTTMVNIIIPVLTALGFVIKWQYELVDPTNPALKDVKRVRVVSAANTRKTMVFWTEGNHEMRLKRHLWALSAGLDGLVTFDKLFSLNKLGIDYVHSMGSQGNGIIHLSPALMVMHGIRHGVHLAKATADDLMVSVITGHGHKESLFRKTSAITGFDATGYSCGSMSKLPLYNTTPNFNQGHIAGWYDDEAPFRHNLFHTRILSQKPQLPQDGKAYPRRVTESDSSVLVTPWAEYRAVENPAGGWSVSSPWRAALCGHDVPASGRVKQSRV